MRRPDGYVTILDPDAPSPMQEFDTAQCCHCGRIIKTKPGTASTVYLCTTLTPTGLILTIEEPGASCWHCMQPVCLPCHDLGTCLPLERRLLQMEGRTG